MAHSFTRHEREIFKNNPVFPWFDPYFAVMSNKVPFQLLMDITNVCSYNCPHCYKVAGNNRMPLADFKTIIGDAVNSPRVKGSIGITGGEPTALYTHYHTHDLKDMIQFGLDQKYDVLLKTNASWTQGKYADVIWRDLESLNFGNQIMGIDVSVDVYHKNVVQTATDVLRKVCLSPKLKDKTVLELISVGNDGHNIDNILAAENLNNAGLVVKNKRFKTRGNRGVYKSKSYAECKINDTRVNLVYNGIIVRVENALKNNIGVIDNMDPLTLISIYRIVLWYDPLGNVHIGNKHKPFFTVPYHHADGSIKTLDQVKNDLGELVFNECKKRLVECIPHPTIKKFCDKVQRSELDYFVPLYKFKTR